jgi:hypothetical protein
MAKKAEQAKKANGKSNASAKAKEPGKREELHGQSIKLLVKENPRREGTSVHKIFGLMKTGMTVGEFLEKGEKLGAKMGHIRKAESRKWISLK